MQRKLTVSKSLKFDPVVGVTDFIDGARRVSLWMAFASDEIQQRYRRSKLGLAWIVISYLIFVGAVSIFFGSFSQMESGSFSIYVAVNFAIFLFALACITDGCMVFRTAKTWISSTPLPHSVHIFKSMARGLFVFVINLLIAILMMYLAGERLTWLALMAIPAFILLLFNGLLAHIIFGYVTARFRDVEHLMQSITRIMYFTTPVLWVRNEHQDPGIRDTIAELNPFTHALEIFSAPILGSYADPYSWVYMAWLTLILFVSALVIAGYSHKRLGYWL